MDSTAPPAEEESVGGWGLSTVTSAFGGWGLTSSEPEPTTTSTTNNTEPTTPATTTTSAFEDDEWKQSAEQVEDAAAAVAAQAYSSLAAASSYFATSPGAGGGEGEGGEGTTTTTKVEDVVGETANMAAAAASSFFSGASTFLSGGDDDGDANNDDGGDGNNNDGTNNNNKDIELEKPDALRKFLDYNPLNHLASQWIDDLERANVANDPHRLLRSHLDSHLVDWPRSTYEEWVEEALAKLDGWDAGSAVVDDTFYLEGCVHRILWNERMVVEDEDAGGDGSGEGGDDGEEDKEGGDGGEAMRKKRYVPARKPQGDTTGGAVAAAIETFDSSAETPVSMEETVEFIKAKGAAATTAAVVTTSTSILDTTNFDADLDGLLGDDDNADDGVAINLDDEEEVSFETMM